MFILWRYLKKTGSRRTCRLNPTGAPEVRFQIKAEDIDTVFLLQPAWAMEIIKHLN